MKKKPQHLQHMLTEVKGVSLPRYFWTQLTIEANLRETSISALVKESVKAFLDIREKNNT